MYGGAHKRITKLVKSTIALAEAMDQLLEFCSEQVDSPVWGQLRQLDFPSDQGQLSDWLEKLITTKPPPQKIKGLWFGLYNRRLEDGLSTCALHLAGSTRFNFADPALDCFSDPSYLPANNVARSTILTTIYRTVEPDPSASAQGEYTLCWGFASLLVRDWCRGPLRGKLLGLAERRGVAVGFDSGDGLVVDILTRA